MRYDEDLSDSEKRLITELKGKNRMEQDEIIGNYERFKNKGRGGA